MVMEVPESKTKAEFNGVSQETATPHKVGNDAEEEEEEVIRTCSSSYYISCYLKYVGLSIINCRPANRSAFGGTTRLFYQMSCVLLLKKAWKCPTFYEHSKITCTEYMRFLSFRCARENRK